MKKKLLPALLLALCPIFLAAQEQLFYDFTAPESNIHAAINPMDSCNMIVVAVRVNVAIGRQSISVHSTQDCGVTWSTGGYSGLPDSTYFGASDPVVSFNQNGIAFITNSAVTNGQESALVLARSNNGGLNWSRQIVDDQNYAERPWSVTDNSPTSPYKGRKYIAYTSAANIMDCAVIGTNNTVINSGVPLVTDPDIAFGSLATIATNADGKIFAAFYTEGGLGSAFVITKSENGGQVFSPEKLIVPVNLYPGLGGPIRGIEVFSHSPRLAIDNGNGPHRNRIYFTYTDNEAGTFFPLYLDTYITWSDDDGETWSTPKTIHPEAPAGTQQFFSTMDVNEDGALSLGWYDRRNYADDTLHAFTDYYYAISLDGGDSLCAAKLNSAPADFDSIGVDNDYFGIGTNTQIVSTKYSAIAFWSDGRNNNGDINLYFSKRPLVCDTTSAMSEVTAITDQIQIGAASPNPAHASSAVSIFLQKNCNLQWRLFSSEGKLVRSAAPQNYAPGTHTLQIPLENVPNGTYFVEMSDDQHLVKTFKLVKI